MPVPLGIYVHIPFCERKCRYCDFVSYAQRNREEQRAYIDRICSEIKEKGRELSRYYNVDTIFFGGGTPSLLEADELVRVLDCIYGSFVFGGKNASEREEAPDNSACLEISLEANPGSISDVKLEKLRASGFNRISIGVQSFDDGILKTLGRIHGAAQAKTAVRSAKVCGFNTNIDLIFGVPGQTESLWEKDLAEAISLDPEHISFYSLQLEEGTPLYYDYRFGKLSLPSWSENRAMYHRACDMLAAAGYIHYEISNAAKPGYQCRHNLKYWSMQDYLGIGEAAHSFINGKRTGEDSPDMKSDYIFTRLRLTEGFSVGEYAGLFGRDFSDEFRGAYDEELLHEEDGFIRFTKKGLDHTNPVMQRLLNVIHENAAR